MVSDIRANGFIYRFRKLGGVRRRQAHQRSIERITFCGSQTDCRMRIGNVAARFIDLAYRRKRIVDVDGRCQKVITA